MFWIVLLSFIPFRLLFLNIFWIFVHSCICSITVLQNKKVWLHSSIHISSSVDNCITPHYNPHHCLAHHVHFYHSHHQQSEPSYIHIVPKLPSKFTLSFRHTLILGIVSIIHHLLWKDWRTSVLHFQSHSEQCYPILKLLFWFCVVFHILLTYLPHCWHISTYVEFNFARGIPLRLMELRYSTGYSNSPSTLPSLIIESAEWNVNSFPCICWSTVSLRSSTSSFQAVKMVW